MVRIQMFFRTKLIAGRYPALESFFHIYYYNFDNQTFVISSKLSQDFKLLNTKKNPLQDFEFNESSILIGFLLTTDCNLRCRYCFAHGGRGKKIDLEYKNAKIFIDEIISKRNNSLEIYFAGGEPTYNPSVLIQIIEYLDTLHISKNLRIQTNGIMSNELLDFLLRHQVHLQISYDGLPTLQDIQRPGINNIGTSEQVIQTIKKAIQFDKNKTQITVTVTDKSVNKLVDIVLHLHELGVSVVQFEPVGKVVGEFSNMECKKPKVNTFVRNFIKAYEVGSKLDMIVFTSAISHLYSPCSKYCHYKSKLTLTADSKITLCDTVTNINHPLAKYFIIGEINGGKLKYSINNVFTRSVNNLKKCRNCFAKYICAGGCINKAVAETGNVDTIDSYSCKMNKKIIKKVLRRMI